MVLNPFDLTYRVGSHWRAAKDLFEFALPVIEIGAGVLFGNVAVFSVALFGAFIAGRFLGYTVTPPPDS